MQEATITRVGTFVALALMAGGIILAVRAYTSGQRAENAAQTTIRTAADSIRTLERDLDSLRDAARATDSTYAGAVRAARALAVIPERVRDSLASLTHTLDSLQSQGDTLVPISIGEGLASVARACTQRVDSLATVAIPALTSACEQRVADRDAMIARHEGIEHEQSRQITALASLIAGPRVIPFGEGRYGLIHHSWRGEGGVMLRLFGSWNATTALDVGSGPPELWIGARREFR